MVIKYLGHARGLTALRGGRFFFLNPDQEIQGDTNEQETSTLDPDKKFTQADIDRILKERLDRQKAKITEDVTKNLGVETLEDAKKLIEATKEAERANQTELERVKADLDKVMKERDDAVATATTASEGLKIERLYNEIRSQLSAANVANLQDAVTLLTAGDISNFMKDDKPDPEVIKSAVEAMSTEKPYLFGTSQDYKGTGSSKDKRNPNSGDEAKQAALKRLEQRVFNRG